MLLFTGFEFGLENYLLLNDTVGGSYCIHNFEVKGKAKGTFQQRHEMGKGKAIPLQTWTGPEGSRKLRLPDFKTIGT